MSEPNVNNQPQEDSNEQNQTNDNNIKKTKGNKPKEIEFIISRHRMVFEMLEKPRQAFRATVMMVVFLLTLFAGLTIIALSIKRTAPYSAIMSNEYGAFLMQTEEKEIYNFMFNTAEIFANSGVEVKKGDKITIKASGKFHTAVQHLADINIDALWLGPEGDENPQDPRDEKLQDLKVFLAPGKTAESLLCIVLNKEQERTLKNYLEAQDNYLKTKKKGDNNKTKQDKVTKAETYRDTCMYEMCKKIINTEKNVIFEKIGKEKDFRASQDGKLFFVINDIIFTKKVNTIISMEYDKGLFHSLVEKKGGMNVNDTIWSTTTNYKTDYNNRLRVCPDAWYLDNVGSFLITIEKPKE